MAKAKTPVSADTAQQNVVQTSPPEMQKHYILNVDEVPLFHHLPRGDAVYRALRTCLDFANVSINDAHYRALFCDDLDNLINYLNRTKSYLSDTVTPDNGSEDSTPAEGGGLLDKVKAMF